MKHQLICCGYIMAGILTFMSCINDKDYGTPLEAADMIAGLQMNVGDNLPLAVGMSKKVEVSVPDSITYPVLKWTSSNPAAATVSQDGSIEANALGSTVVTISQEPNMASLKTINVTVMPVATSMTVNADELFENTSKPVDVTKVPANAYNVFKWHSSDEKIATVDSAGNIKGVSPGTVEITAETIDGSQLTSSAIFTVKKIIPVEGINLSPIGYDLGIGDEGQIGCTLQPSNATVDMLTWSSSNTSVATVNNGIVKGTGIGTVTITATDPTSKKTASVNVTVGIGTFNQNFAKGFGAWTYDQNYMESLDYKDDHVTVAMKLNGKYNFPVSYKPATFNAGTYRYLAFKLVRPTKYKFNDNSEGTIFMDMSWVGRYMNQQNNYSIAGYENPADAPQNEPVVIYFDLQKNFGADWYLKNDGEQKQDMGFTLGIYDIPSSFSNKFDLYWVHTFKTLDDLNAFVKSGK